MHFTILPDPEFLLEIAKTQMPFGKYKDWLLIDLPEPYVMWFSREGFRRGERWVKWLIPSLTIIWLGSLLYVSINIAQKTQAPTPWPVGILVLVITVIAFLLSGVLSKNGK